MVTPRIDHLDMSTIGANGSNSAMAFKTTDAITVMPGKEATKDDTTLILTPACHEVLAVPHILKAIISGLDPAQITQAKRVSTHWRSTIMDSRQVREARSLKPTRRFQVGHYDAVPYYSTPSITFSPAIVGNRHTYQPGSIRPTHASMVSFFFKTPRAPDLPSRLPDDPDYAWPDEFITSPRCSEVQMTKFHRIQVQHGTHPPSMALSWGETRTVRVPAGMKIKDVIDATRLMKHMADHDITSPCDVGFQIQVVWSEDEPFMVGDIEAEHGDVFEAGISAMEGVDDEQ